jgi:23S rRNA (adenine2503-C2)-methyltransferase
MQNLLSFNREKLLTILKQNNISQQHGKSIFKAIYQNLAFDIGKYSFLPKKFLSLQALLNVELPKVHTYKVSTEDSSIKLILELAIDGNKIETVLIPEKNRLTLCVSSQVGCLRGCVFCATGKMGLHRNLLVEEIVAQLLCVKKWLSLNKNKESFSIYTNNNITNIVFMGMGEPLDNIDNLILAIEILSDPWGLAIALKKITVSTAGQVAGLKKLRESGLRVHLALSLHASSNTLRSQLMPINKLYPLEILLQEIRAYSNFLKKEIFIQYVLFANINDTIDHAKQLLQIFKQIPVKINLIPFNTTSHSRFSTPTINTIKAFQNILIKAGVRTTIRFSKGRDIDAACGQLIVKQTIKKEA